MASVPLFPKRHHLDWKAIANLFGQFPLHVMGHAEHGSVLSRFSTAFMDRGMAMTRHERTKAKVVVNVFVAVQVTKLAALSLFHENRVRIIGSIVAGDAQWNAFEVFLWAAADFGVRRSKVSSSFCNSGTSGFSKDGSSRSDCGH